MILRSWCLQGKVMHVRCCSSAAAANLSQMPGRSARSQVSRTSSAVSAADTLHSELNKFADKAPTGVSLKSLLKYGSNPTEKTLLGASAFLHHELPIRFAKRAVELDNLPYGLSKISSIRQVKGWYMKSFEEVTNFPRPTSIESERKFTNLVKEIYERHSGTLWMIAKAVYQLKKTASIDDDSTVFDLEREFPEVQRFLDNFFISRVGIRVLIGQHIALHEAIDGWVGLICVRTSPSEISRNAVEAAKQSCIMRYGTAPSVIVSGDLDRAFPYVPAHLHHMVYEVVKNSMRAVIEHHGLDQPSDAYPAIKVVIVDRESNEDVCIKVMDEGGGIPRAELQSVWSYMYTTAIEDAKEIFDSLDSGEARDFGGNIPLAGMGYGLPISRVFARYLGGDMELVSMEGYGTDAYIHMRSLGDSPEPLP